MSKSVGNFVTINQLLHERFGGRDWPGEVLRLAMLMTHYREPMDFTLGKLEEAASILARLYGALRRAADVAPLGDMPSPEFVEAISDDLNTPGAMATLFALSSEIERAMTAGDLQAVGIAKAELIASGAILGVLLSTPDQWFESGVDDALRVEVEALLAERVTARRQGLDRGRPHPRPAQRPERGGDGQPDRGDLAAEGLSDRRHRSCGTPPQVRSGVLCRGKPLERA